MQQSSISEYESHCNAPNLDVVEWLLGIVDFVLGIKPLVDFVSREDPEIGEYVVPDRLWSVPMPDRFS